MDILLLVLTVPFVFGLVMFVMPLNFKLLQKLHIVLSIIVSSVLLSAVNKVVNGAEKVLAYTKYRNPSKAKPFKLTASAAGNQLKIRLSSTAFANATDDAFADGKAGFFIMQPASNLTHSMDNVYIRKNELPPGPG